MATALPLRAALTRGALVTAANWPVVLIEFLLESLYKLALAVPIVGGAFMVAVLVGADVRVLFDEGLRSAVELVADSLENAPMALGSFLAAVGLVAFGGVVIVCVVKVGTLSTIVAGDRAAGELQRGPITGALVRRAGVYDAAGIVAAARAFGRRGVTLAVGLSAAYALVGVAYVGALAGALRLAESAVWGAAWPLVVLISTSAGLVAVATVNLAYDLLRVIVVTDNCDVRAAVGRLRQFIVKDARQVLGIFGVVWTLVVLATAASWLITAGLTFVAWVPLVGLIALPLRAAAWLLQGLMFQFVALAAVAAYQTQYRRFAAPAAPLTAAPRLLEPA